MRLIRSAALGGASVLVLAGCGGGSANLGTFADSVSYAIGMNMGASLGPAAEEIDFDVLLQGMRDMAAEEAALEIPDAQRVLQAFTQQMQEQQNQEMVAQAETNQTAGDAYRAENGGREGVQTTASGLQYEVLQEGDGPKPTRADRVTVHYRGTLPDGTEFDSSVGGDPVTFALTQVISGWTEGLQLMNVGSKYRFVLPPALGYGVRGSPPNIGPNSTLVFEVELIEIAN